MPNLVQAMMQQTIAYGGIAATRRQVYEDIKRRLPSAPQYGIGSADWWAFSPPAVPPEEVDQLVPWGVVCFGCNLRNVGPMPHQEESLCDPCYQKIVAETY